MGGFYGSVQVRCDDRQRVRSALDDLSGKKNRFLLGPVLNGWVGVYPDGAGQDFGVARTLARRLGGELVALLVHDDDVFAYEYYRDGKRIDQYNSMPDYFGAVSEKEKAQLRGRPATLRHLAHDPSRFDALATRLAGQANAPSVFASELLEEFAGVLGIKNALTSYEYLKENDETDETEGWDQFVHVPDLSQEQAKRRAGEEALWAEKQRLIAEGRLLAERGGFVGLHSPSAWWCPSSDGEGFLVAWGSHDDSHEVRRNIEYYGPPWSAGPKPTRWEVGRTVFGMELSPTGRYLAAAHAAGDWRASLWDLSESRLVADVPQVHAVRCVGFLPDESAMFSVSSDNADGRVIITPTGPGESRVFEISDAKLATVDPTGSWLLVADEKGRLLVVDMATGKVARTRFVGGRKVPTAQDEAMMRQVQSTVASFDLDAVKERARQQMLEMLARTGLPPDAAAIENLERAIEQQIQTLQEQWAKDGPHSRQGANDRGSEILFRIGFDASGERVCLATSAGIRVYPWHEILNADGDLLRPALAVDGEETSVETEHGSANRPGFMYDFDHDPIRDRLLFGGLDGRVHFLDLASGHSGVLFEPPGRPPILRLALSRDRTALAITSYPDMHARGSKRRGWVVQFWNYQAVGG